MADLSSIQDRLMYNQLYAPDYPAEDRTDLLKEKVHLVQALMGLMTSNKRRPDTIRQLELCIGSVELAFDLLVEKRSSEGRSELESALRYFADITKRKSSAPDFVVGQDGVVQKRKKETKGHTPTSHPPTTPD